MLLVLLIFLVLFILLVMLLDSMAYHIRANSTGHRTTQSSQSPTSKLMASKSTSSCAKDGRA